jgi:hypothetical protein
LPSRRTVEFDDHADIGHCVDDLLRISLQKGRGASSGQS